MRRVLAEIEAQIFATDAQSDDDPTSSGPLEIKVTVHMSMTTSDRVTCLAYPLLPLPIINRPKTYMQKSGDHSEQLIGYVQREWYIRM